LEASAQTQPKKSTSSAIKATKEKAASKSSPAQKAKTRKAAQKIAGSNKRLLHAARAGISAAFFWAAFLVLAFCAGLLLLAAFFFVAFIWEDVLS